MRVIALAGAARAGKNTVGAIIKEALPDLDVRCEGFADRLKVSAARALGFDGPPHELVATMDQLKVCGNVTTQVEHGQYDVQESYLSGREFLQRYGTESHRDVFGPNFWADQTLPLHPLRDDCDLLVITDLRFENETLRVHEYGGEVWEVVGRGDTGTGHASEVPVPSHLVTCVLSNRGTMDDLRGTVRTLLGGRML